VWVGLLVGRVGDPLSFVAWVGCGAGRLDYGANAGPVDLAGANQMPKWHKDYRLPGQGSW